MLEDDIHVSCQAHNLLCHRLTRPFQIELNYAHHNWVFANVLRYMYELECQVDSADDKVPSMSIPTCGAQARHSAIRA